MGYSSQAGQVGFRTQSVRGSYNDPGDDVTPGLFSRLRSGALGTNRDLLVPDAEIGGTRDDQDSYLGAVSWSGDYEFYLRPNITTLLLANALGDSAAVTTTGHTVYTVTPADGPALPFMSVEERIGSGLETYNYTDAVINTLHLESDANGYASGTLSLIGAKQISGATATAVPNWDTTPIVVGTKISVTYNGIALPAKSFSFDINNNFEDDDFRLGSFFLGDLVPKSRKITAGFTIRPEDSDIWRQAVYGNTGATEVLSGVTLKQALVITITSYENIATGTPSAPYSIVLNVPKMIVNPFSFAPSGDDIIQDDITMNAVRPSFGSPIMTAVSTTDMAALP